MKTKGLDIVRLPPEMAETLGQRISELQSSYPTNEILIEFTAKL